jgi:hypothetical protein
MSLTSTAQMIEEIVVTDMSDAHDHDHEHKKEDEHVEVLEAPIEHVVFYAEEPPQELVEQMHDPILHGFNGDGSEMLSTTEPGEVIIDIADLPGVEALDPALEDLLEVSDEPGPDENDAKKSKKPEKWDWEAHGAEGFLAWVKTRISEVPAHSGYDTAGIERAISYLDRLDNEISKAMRLDLDGELDANKIEDLRKKIEDGVDRLNARHDKVNRKSKGKKKKKSTAEGQADLIKQAGTTRIDGIVITVPLLISRIARVCVNGNISAGHDIEDLFVRQAEHYKLDLREKAELMQLLADMGYPLRQDRGFDADEDVDMASSDNFDWAANYNA